MAKDVLYTNGIIAVKEGALLKDKLLKFCESGAAEVFRSLTEGGFGKGAEAASVYEYEKLLAADERDIDGFIREYAPTNAEREYLLSPRDFHNAKAAIKAEYLQLSAEEAAPLYAPDGLYCVADLIGAVKSGEVSAFNKELAQAVLSARELCFGAQEGEEEKAEISGADIGAIFDKALYEHLVRVCARNIFLKKCVRYKADMLNILTALRSQTPEYAAAYYVSGGSLSEKRLSAVFTEEGVPAEGALQGTVYSEFYEKCASQKKAGLPMTDAERISDGLETFLLAERKYELKSSQPFLYYVFRRRAENANLRILFVCLLAGADERDIKKRLRAY